jgi:4-carboxymuconolactone decarboxylase
MADDTFERGLATRKEVLGAEHVERSLAGADDFSRPYQEAVTEYCWGAIWNRPGLDRRTRSLLNLAMLTALNREDEFRLHVRAAFRNGVTRDEIREVLLQAMIYCGVPAANSAFKQAREVFAQMEREEAAADQGAHGGSEP